MAVEVHGIAPAVADIHAAIVQGAVRGNSVAKPLGDEEIVDEPLEPRTASPRSFLTKVPGLGAQRSDPLR